MTAIPHIKVNSQEKIINYFINIKQNTELFIYIWRLLTLKFINP